MESPHIPLNCPFCLESLESITSPSPILKCKNCLKEFPYKNGIPILSSGKTCYFQPISKEDFRRIMDEKEGGWMAKITYILSKIPEKSLEAWEESLFNMGRTAWSLLLPLSKRKGDMKVLDIGAGWGRITLDLSSMASLVVATELTHERLELLKVILDGEKRKNIALIEAGGTPHLPFPDRFFDLIVVNGVLEWVPVEGRGDPYLQQLDFLKEIKRLIKDDGILFIGIENRMALEYLLARPDAHSGLLFASLLPRWAANIYSRVVRRTPYLTYTHTRWGLEKLGKKAGFFHSVFYPLSPSYRVIRDMGKRIETRPPTETKEGLKRRIESILSLNLAPSFGAFLSPSAIDPPFLHLLIKEAISSSAVLTGKINVSAKGVLSLNLDIHEGGESKKVVLKIPLSPVSEVHLEKGFTNLKVIRKFSAGSPLEKMLPEPLNQGEYEGVRFFVEEFIEGRRADEYLKRIKWDRAEDLISSIAHTIIEINRSKEDFGMAKIKGEEIPELFKGIFTPPFNPEISKRLKGGVERFYRRAEEFIMKTLNGVSIPLVRTKGDSGISNFLVSKDGSLKGVIDWDLSMEEGLPLIDILCLIESVRRAKYRTGLSDFFITYLEEPFFGIEKRVIEEAGSGIKLEAERILPSFLLLSFLYHIHVQKDYLLNLRRTWMEMNFVPVVEQEEQVFSLLMGRS